jgi:hypothetical protein
MAQGEGELVQYQEQRLLALPGAEFEPDAQGGEVDASPQTPYLGTDIFIGTYGVAAFAMVVPHAREYPQVYTAEEGGSPGFYRHDGFVILRSVLAPPSVIEALQEDSFLGDPLISKCALDGTVPPELHELTTLEEPASWQSSAAMVFEKDVVEEHTLQQRELNPYTKHVALQLEAATSTHYDLLREYPSWHDGYKVYASVIQAMVTGCQATVANFDKALALLAKDVTPVHDFGAVELGRTTLAALTEHS